MIFKKFPGRLLFFLLLTIIVSPLLPGNTIKIPGNLKSMSQYLKHYTLTAENFLYYMNEILLLDHLPTIAETGALLEKKTPLNRSGRIAKKFSNESIRIYQQQELNKCLSVLIKRYFSSHKKVKKILRAHTGKELGPVSLDLMEPGQKEVARKLADATGFQFIRHTSGRYMTHENSTPPYFEVNHYFKMVGFNPLTIEKALNRHRRLELEIGEFDVKCPWSIDYLKRITGITLTPANVGEVLSKNRRFQLLLGILYRLSNREIAYIDGLAQDLDAWKRIYTDDRFLCGMFVLSHALRVKDNRLLFPGGPDTIGTWSTLAGIDYHLHPLRFLEALATKDRGKLNYFYVFTYFLAPETRKAVFTDFSPAILRTFYQPVELDKKERIRGLKLPGLKDMSFFTMPYILKTRNGHIDFPGGLDTWCAVMGLEDHSQDDNAATSSSPSSNLSSSPNRAQRLLAHILAAPKKQKKLERFISLYTRFQYRPELLTLSSLKALFDHYENYNVMVDFIEKIPIKNPQNVVKLFKWAKSFYSAGKTKGGRRTVTAVFQSLLEFIANSAAHQPEKYDYDRLVEHLMAMPMTGTEVYDGFFRFLENHLDIDTAPTRVDKAFLTFLAPGSRQNEINVHGQPYVLEGPGFLKDEISLILEKQSVTSLSRLIRINRYLHRLADPSQDHLTIADIDAIASELSGELRKLPLPETGNSIPLYLKDYLKPYSTSGLFKNMEKLIRKRKEKISRVLKQEHHESRDLKPASSLEDIAALSAKIKRRWLLTELKNVLVTATYAINIKNSRLQIFIATNLTRYHDFSYHPDRTPWNHSHISNKIAGRQVYHLEGGLSRLNILLAVPVSDYLFSRTLEFDLGQRVPLVFNHMDIFPHTGIRQAQEYTGLLLSFADEIMQKALVKNNTKLRQALAVELAPFISGYHYRNTVNLLDNLTGTRSRQELSKRKALGFQLYYSEALNLAEMLFREKRWLHQFSQAKKLEAFRESSVKKPFKQDMDRMGSIFYYTFGSLKSKRLRLFPQPLSHLFNSCWVGGEMINEFKIKTAYISHLKQFPPQLLGTLAYRHLFMAVHLYSQNFINDYDKIYFMYNTFNYLYLNSIYKELRRIGMLRIK